MKIPWPLMAACLLIVAVSIPLILNKVPKNPFYGLRTHRSLSGTDEDWYRINHAAGIGYLIAGIVSALACLLLPSLLTDPRIVTQCCAVILLLSVVIATCVSMLQ